MSFLTCSTRTFKMKLHFFFLFFVIVLFCETSSEEIGNNKLNEVTPRPLSEPIQRALKLLEDFRNVTEPGAVCSKCKQIVTVFIAFRKSGANRESVRSALSDACISFLGYLPSVCRVFSDIETDVIIYIIDNKNVKPEEVCGIYFQHIGCTNPRAKKWIIDIPSKTNISEPVYSSSVEPLKIVQITDVHYDPLYSAGSNAKCDMPLCCEERNNVPADPENAAGQFGDYRVCDMPKNSVVNLLTEIKKSQKIIDYVYFTGDIIAHKNWETSRESNLETIKEFYNFLFQYLGNVSVYPILGNHEAHPCNLFAPLNVSLPDTVGTKWLFDAVADYWSKWLPKSALDTIKLGGFYTVLVRPGFRIIALNSNVCFTENFWLFFDDEDPYGQLKWLVQILLEAEKNQEKVHILSHVPPGEALCHRQWQYNFNRIVRRFAKTISAHFNGHTHNDEFRIYKSESNPNEVVNVAYNGGSFTTFVGLNPDYRVYDVESNNLMVSDYHQYTFNLSLANSPKTNGPAWYKLYSFKGAYGLQNLNYNSLLDLDKRLHSDSKLAQQYVQFYVRESEIAFEKGCNETCIKSQVCHISAVDADESIRCGQYTVA